VFRLSITRTIFSAGGEIVVHQPFYLFRPVLARPLFRYGCPSPAFQGSVSPDFEEMKWRCGLIGLVQQPIVLNPIGFWLLNKSRKRLRLLLFL
jgi:hypothetical protein